MMESHKAASVRQPEAQLLVSGRLGVLFMGFWRKGWTLIHASARLQYREIELCKRPLVIRALKKIGHPDPFALPRQAIIGAVKVKEIIRPQQKAFFSPLENYFYRSGNYQLWLIEDAVCFEKPIPHGGKPGAFDTKPEVSRQLQRQLQAAE